MGRFLPPMHDWTQKTVLLPCRASIEGFWSLDERLRVCEREKEIRFRVGMNSFFQLGTL